MSVIFYKTKKKATEQDQQPGSPNSMGHMIKVLEHIFPRSAQGLWTYFAPRGHFIPEHLADTKVRTDVTKIKGPYTVRVKFYSPSSAPFIRSLSICGVLEKTKVSIAAIAAIAYFALLNLYHFLMFDIFKNLIIHSPQILHEGFPQAQISKWVLIHNTGHGDRNHKIDGHGFVQSMMQVPGRTLCSFSIELDPPHHILFIQLGSSLAELLLWSLGLLANFITDLRTKVGLKSLECRLSPGLHRT